MRRSGGHIGDFKDLKSKIARILDELASVKGGLETNQIFESIKSTSNLDSEALIANYEKLVNDALKGSINLPVQFVYADASFSGFLGELKKLVRT